MKSSVKTCLKWGRSPTGMASPPAVRVAAFPTVNVFRSPRSMPVAADLGAGPVGVCAAVELCCPGHVGAVRAEPHRVVVQVVIAAVGIADADTRVVCGEAGAALDGGLDRDGTPGDGAGQGGGGQLRSRHGGGGDGRRQEAGRGGDDENTSTASPGTGQHECGAFLSASERYCRVHDGTRCAPIDGAEEQTCVTRQSVRLIDRRGSNPLVVRRPDPTKAGDRRRP